MYLVSGGGKVWVAEFMCADTVIYGWRNAVDNPVVEAWMPLPKPYRKPKS